MIAFLLISAYVLCGVLTFGLGMNFTIAKFPGLTFEECHKIQFPGLKVSGCKYSRRGDLFLHTLFALTGPFGLFAVAINIGIEGGPWGLRFNQTCGPDDLARARAKA